MIGYVRVNDIMLWFLLYALQLAGHTNLSFMGAFPKEYLVGHL